MRLGSTIGFSAAATEPVVGWKIWRVQHGEGHTRLRSVLYGSLWPPGRPAVAECKKWLRVPHEPPDPRCECGIHAAKSLVAWRHYLSVGGDRVFGRALLSGELAEGSLGWRATRAYPLELYVPRELEDAESVAAGLAVYGVPVEVVGSPIRRPELVPA